MLLVTPFCQQFYLYIVVSESMVPFDNLFAGVLASQICTLKTLLVRGIVCVLGAVIFVSLSIPQNISRKFYLGYFIFN